MRRTLALASCLLLCCAASVRADKISLVAGGGTEGDGPATKAKLIQPFGVDCDRLGGVWIVEMANGERLRAVSPDGSLITFAGSEGKKGNDGDH